MFSLYGENAGFPDVVHCERIVDRARGHGWVITPHRHSAMAQIFWLEGGEATAIIDGQAQQIKPGQFLYVPAQVVHGFDFAPDTEGVVVSIPLATLQRADPDDNALPGPDRPFARQIPAEFAHLLRLVIDGYSSAGIHRAQYLSGLVSATIAALAALAPTGHREVAVLPKIAALDALLTEHMGKGWRPRDYAAALHITTGQLTRLCHAARGQSASACIESTAMTEACRLLAFTRLPVAEVGYRLGYGDPSHFSRRFAAVVGERPSRYRARFAG